MTPHQPPYKTTEEAWAFYSKTLYGKMPVGEIQKAETRQAFIAGAASMLDMFTAIAQMRERDGCQRLEALHEEIRQLIKGRLSELITSDAKKN